MDDSGEVGEPSVSAWTVAVDAADRLDVVVAEHAGLSRSRAAALIEAGEVRVNGVPARKRDLLRAGDRVELRIPPPTPSSLTPEAIPLEIVFQDADLAVINKPAGMVVHPAPGHATGTLVHALLAAIPDLSGIGGTLRPGVVHRLDRDTSGLLLIAKHDDAHRALADALRRREVRRRYLTAAWGHLPEELVTVDAPIARHPRDRLRMAVVPEGRPARTHFVRLARWPAADLLQAELETGRTHQIRVHLLHIGHPVVGDAVYAPGRERGWMGTAGQWARTFAARVPRQFLHAAELHFAHPRTGQTMEFTVPLPPDLAAAAPSLRPAPLGGAADPGDTTAARDGAADPSLA